MNTPPIIPRGWSTGRGRALGTVLWFMRGIPPRSVLSHVLLFKQMKG